MQSLTPRASSSLYHNNNNATEIEDQLSHHITALSLDKPATQKQIWSVTWDCIVSISSDDDDDDDDDDDNLQREKTASHKVNHFTLFTQIHSHT